MKLTLIGLALASASAVGLAIAADPPAQDAKTTKHAAEKGVTALDQQNNQADIDLAAAVRSAIVDDESLSTSAKNVTMVAAGGHVTLRGTVASADDKARVESIVSRVAGVKRVTNQIALDTP
ncbi:BON domain-containing protein [Dokdonella sp. MW10]|uniref:BON domain-containing protein n=1 Tax=Dokdonella sp. MW10 TaxID=2992926 RepID=UPI003F802EDC